MQVRSSIALSKEYSGISALARNTQEPVYITVDGEEDGVFMNIDAYEKREEIMKLRQNIMEAEQQRIRGDKTYSIEEIRMMLKKRLDDVTA